MLFLGKVSMSVEARKRLVFELNLSAPDRWTGGSYVLGKVLFGRVWYVLEILNIAGVQGADRVA